MNQFRPEVGASSTDSRWLPERLVPIRENKEDLWAEREENDEGNVGMATSQVAMGMVVFRGIIGTAGVSNPAQMLRFS